MLSCMRRLGDRMFSSLRGIYGSGNRLVRIVILTPLAALAACSAEQSASNTRSVSDGGTVTVVLSNFSFEPDHIRLKAGKPVRLHLVNESNGGHNFSTPTFFAASSFPPGLSAPGGGAVDVASHQAVDIALVPRQPGTYQLKCTHTLHDLFGMTGAIEVTP
jgi:uncharacterized cupredoxin-like copper-binding protein